MPGAGGSVADTAFTERVHDHIPRLMRLARRLVGSEDLAWDAVQESLLALWRASEPPVETRAWLARTVIHRSLHIRRTLRRRRHYEQRAADAIVGFSLVRDPARQLAVKTLRAEIQVALGRLPSGQLRAFLLREVEGLDYAEIAHRLSVPIGTIRSRLARARVALRDALRE